MRSAEGGGSTAAPVWDEVVAQAPWRGHSFADKRTLTGELVTLRPIPSDGADTIDRLVREDDEIARLNGSTHTSTEEGQSMSVEGVRAVNGAWARSTERLILAIIVKPSGDLVRASCPH
ncbi:MAG: hypothetical protein WA966_04435 [Ornithinimicrobium sp.]